MFRFLPLIFVLLLTPPVPAQEQPSATAVADAVVYAIELIDAKHINPPTSQELLKRVITLIRAGVSTEKVLPRANGVLVPRSSPQWSRRLAGISSMVSKLSTTDEFRTALIDELTNDANQKALDSLGHDPLQPILSALGVRVQPSREAAVEKQIQANRYVGIGIGIGVQQETPIMMQVMPGGAAEKGGARAKDLIVSVDGKPTQGVPLATIVKWLRGQQGTSVDVQLQRKDKLIALKLVRDVVPMKTVHVEYIKRDVRTIAYIRLDRIGASSVHELREMEREIRDKQVFGILLDCRVLHARSAPLHETKLMADALIADQTIGYHITRDSKIEITAGPLTLFEGIPIVVMAHSLVSGPPEWLIAALQQAGRARFVGIATAGEGLATDDFTLPDAPYTLTFPTGLLQTADGRTLVTPKPLTDFGAISSLTTRELRAMALRDSGGISKSTRLRIYAGQVVPDEWISASVPPPKWADFGVEHLQKMVSDVQAKPRAEGASGE